MTAGDPRRAASTGASGASGTSGTSGEAGTVGMRVAAGPLRVAPALQHYPWGDPRFIPELLGERVGTTPVAEAWYGAHPAAPARARRGDDEQTLDRWIDADPQHWLGGDVAARFDGLPYLLKVLAAARPLSIQVHPDAAQARAGFDREEALGVPRDGSRRNYRDPRHKPELLVALTEFHALCGFRPAAALRAALAALPELAALLPRLDDDPASLRALLTAWFELDDAVVLPALTALMARLEAENARQSFSIEEPAHWALRVHRDRAPDAPPDRGLLMMFLLELLALRPGQGLFLAAGVPHAYLQGAGVELMASSDNVLRAGLTSKHVDAAELLAIVRFDGPGAVLLEADEDGSDGTAAAHEVCWTTGVDEFLLSRLRLVDGTPVLRRAQGPETLLALPRAGAVRVELDDQMNGQAAGDALMLGAGAACLIPAGAAYRIAAEDAVVFRVRVPLA